MIKFSWLLWLVAYFLFVGQAISAPVLPETTVLLNVSHANINRIVCPAPIQDTVFDETKGVSVKHIGRDVFVKFLTANLSDAVPVELFLVCDGDVYSLVLNPIEMALQTVHLSSGNKKRIVENRELFAGLAYEEKLSQIILGVLTDQVPEGFTVAIHKAPVTIFRDIKLELTRIITIDGEGLRVKEYLAELIGESPVTISESDFITAELSAEPIAVSIDMPHLTTTSRIAKILIIERRAE
jgi:conjugal transfer pilus assembly protein TraK